MWVSSLYPQVSLQVVQLLSLPYRATESSAEMIGGSALSALLLKVRATPKSNNAITQHHLSNKENNECQTRCFPKWVCMIYIYIYVPVARRPQPPRGGPWPPPHPPQGGGGACGAACSSVRATLWARLRRCSCDALQCDLLILQHATSCSAVAIDIARCYDAVCGLQRHNQVPTKCAATRQWQTHFTCYPSGRCGNHGRGGLCGHTVPPFSPPPIPTGGRGGVGTMDPPTHPTGGRGACRVTLCYLPTEHDHWGGVGGGGPRKPGTYIYIYIYVHTYIYIYIYVTPPNCFLPF